MIMKYLFFVFLKIFIIIIIAFPFIGIVIKWVEIQNIYLL